MESVLGQTFGDIELLVVDDGSTDGTRDILGTFRDPRLRVVPTAHRGVCHARNTAISVARGEWLAFLDSDDEWLPHKIEAQWEVLGRWPQLKIIHTEEIWIRRGIRVNPKKKHAKSGGWIFQQCLPLCLISPSTVMVHRQVLERVGSFDPQMIVCEDYDLWLRITPLLRGGFCWRARY